MNSRNGIRLLSVDDSVGTKEIVQPYIEGAQVQSNSTNGKIDSMSEVVQTLDSGFGTLARRR